MNAELGQEKRLHRSQDDPFEELRDDWEQCDRTEVVDRRIALLGYGSDNAKLP